MATLNQLKRTSARSKARVGRGGRRGKTSGRGTKGQNARAGRKKRPELRDIIKKLPKRRGYGKNRARTVVGTRPDAAAISLTRIEAHFDAGVEVTPASLAERGVAKTRKGKHPLVKIVDGELSKKLVFKNLPVSASARARIEKAGGTVA